MRDDDHGPGPAEVDQGVGHDPRGDGVEVGRGLVEQHPGPVGDDGPGERQTGALTGREPRAFLADHGGRLKPFARKEAGKYL